MLRRAARSVQPRCSPCVAPSQASARQPTQSSKPASSQCATSFRNWVTASASRELCMKTGSQRDRNASVASTASVMTVPSSHKMEDSCTCGRVRLQQSARRRNRASRRERSPSGRSALATEPSSPMIADNESYRKASTPCSYNTPGPLESGPSRGFKASATMCKSFRARSPNPSRR